MRPYKYLRYQRKRKYEFKNKSTLTPVSKDTADKVAEM
jgi:hypothetical protein